MKMQEKVIEALISSIIDIELPDFNIIKSSISSPYIINENEGTCEIDIKIILKEKKKK